MSVRDMIVERTFAPVEVQGDVKKVIDSYHHNRAVFDADYDEHPLYALLKIMTYAKKCAYVIARKNITSFNWVNSAADNYRIYTAYMTDFQIAHDEFVKHFDKDEELLVRLDEIKGKLAKAIAVGYKDNVDLMMDIFDTDSPLYDIEGIEYAR